MSVIIAEIPLERLG